MYEEATIQMPAQMSTLAPDLDATYYAIYWLSVFSFVAIVGTAIYFCIRYRRSKNPQSTPPGHHDKLELFWTFAPLLLLFPMFHYGFKQYMDAIVVPEGAIEVRVKAKKWAWEFYYEGGKLRVPGTMAVPVHEPVKLIMSSEDVLHSFFVPEFRVKRDVVPGMYTSVWFEAVKTTSRLKSYVQLKRIEPGKEGQVATVLAARTKLSADEARALVTSPFTKESPKVLLEDVYVPEAKDLASVVEAAGGKVEIGAAGFEGKPLDQFCTEYCGTSHSKMLSTVHVISREDYGVWIAGAGKKAPGKSWEQWGKELFASNACVTCHRVDGVDWTGPALNGKFGKEEILVDGSSVKVDENYLRESLLQPQAKIVKDFTAANMPPYVLSDDQIDGLIAYLKSLDK